MSVIERVKVRIPEAKEGVREELVTSATDRILLCNGKDEQPTKIETIAVEILTKMYRKMYYEGITSESADTLTVSFVENIFAEYEEEFKRWMELDDDIEGKNKLKVRFI